MSNLENTRFPNVFYINGKLYTKNLAPGIKVYGEDLIKIKRFEYRFWNPHRSKFAALIIKGCKRLMMRSEYNILYLGAANGTTVSHVSDIIENGKVYCIEFSSRSFRDLLNVADNRKNVLPILENAFHPERYQSLVGKVDVIYQDISQRDQVRIFINNSKIFLKPGGFGIFMIKSRSIDIVKSPKVVFKEVISNLKKEGFRVMEEINLDPYSKDHMGLIITMK